MGTVSLSDGGWAWSEDPALREPTEIGLLSQDPGPERAKTVGIRPFLVRTEDNTC